MFGLSVLYLPTIFFVFLVQNDKIWRKMNKKDKIEARKALFEKNLKKYIHNKNKH
jgi:hypothetical protein